MHCKCSSLYNFPVTGDKECAYECLNPGCGLTDVGHWASFNIEDVKKIMSTQSGTADIHRYTAPRP